MAILPDLPVAVVMRSNVAECVNWERFTLDFFLLGEICQLLWQMVGITFDLLVISVTVDLLFNTIWSVIKFQFRLELSYL